MHRSITTVLTVALLALPLAGFADSSYQHTTQVTGGQLIDSFKNMPFMGKQMRALTDPNTETTMVHGNQKAIIGKDYTEIWDLDKEVIIHVDNVKKTYTVTTFADMRKMMQDMPARMAQMQDQMKKAQAQPQGQAPAVPPNLQFNFTVDVKDTGLTKMVDQYNAKQQVLTMKMTVTDTNNPGTNVAYTMTTEIWTTPDVPAEMRDAQDFDRRFGEKMMQGVDVKDLLNNMASMRNGGQMALMQMFGARPGAADAFEQMGKELAKIKGTRLIEITRMGGSGTGMDTQQNGASGGQNNGQAANGNNNGNGSNGNSSTTNIGSPGSMLGGALMGAFKKKKAQQQQDQQAANSAPAGPPGQPGEITLMEMTTSTHNFSSAPVSTNAFQVPAGFKQVQSPMEQMNGK